MPKKKIEIDLENPERHPLSMIFGDVNELDLKALEESILEMGVLDPIIVDDEGRIVDGYQRCRAIQSIIDLGHATPEYTVELTEYPCETVWAKHITRRHLKPRERVQRAIQVDQWGIDNLQGYEPKSQRQIAIQADVSPSTVHRVINEEKDDEEKEPKSTRKTREEELEEELIATRDERDEARIQHAEAEERIAMMTEESKTGKTKESLKAFQTLQKRLKAALTTIDTQKERLAEKDRQIKTLKTQLKQR